MKVRILSFLTTSAQLSKRLKNFLGSWLLVLGIKEGLVECATVCVKSVVILKKTYLTLQHHGSLGQFSRNVLVSVAERMPSRAGQNRAETRKKFSKIFDIENWLWKSDLGTFWRPVWTSVKIKSKKYFCFSDFFGFVQNLREI